MKNLLLVELTRLRWRRAVVVLLVACLLVPVAICLGAAWNTRPFSDADVAEAERLAQFEADQPYIQQEIERCQENPEMYGGGPDVDCVEMITPSAANYLYRQTLDVGSVLDNEATAVVSLLAVVLLVLGTTFVGHDWNTGSISNQLLFEPRRRRVWAAKGLAVLLVGLVVGALALLVFWGAVGVLVAQRDIAVEPGQWAVVRNTAARGVLLVALSGFLGYALTMLLRSTVATLAIGLGVAAAGSIAVLATFGEGAQRWLLPTNAYAVLDNGYEYYVWSPACDVMVQGGTDPCTQTISLGAGATYLAVVLAVVVVASLVSFRRRDLP
ncbi:hypothetical protein EUA06_18285 [Nocardioides glacieisoli]|uniref:ABC transporter permease n=1 Tax=Nocardioides glacieisoli TaxID=1168730 RepID=A0A4Q2RK05_9ACTN|nr:ABC transporter permease subunit [Nocardioides glacieisoli]RYB89050.1 hypothetical protein EUA06_18285 [Nocardioides glacieisoli]